MSSAAIQGMHGAFSHAAALQALGDDVAIVECRTFEDLFRSVVEGAADYGIVPVENTLAGSVQRTMDLLVQNPLQVVGETRVRVRLCLAAPPGRTLGEVRRVGSHPVALEQCLSFFESNPRIRPVTAFDTAGSVRDLIAGDAAYDAAIASELAASLYGASVLQREIEDHAGNFTRFLVVGREVAASGGKGDVPGAAAPERGTMKTSLAFTLPHQPGSLHRALGCFAGHDVDLARIESRPIPGRPWEYRFYVDLRGSDEAAEGAALAALRDEVVELRVLGRYPEAAVERD